MKVKIAVGIAITMLMAAVYLYDQQPSSAPPGPTGRPDVNDIRNLKINDIRNLKIN